MARHWTKLPEILSCCYTNTKKEADPWKCVYYAKLKDGAPINLDTEHESS